MARHTLRVLGRSGDTVIEWDPAKTEEIEEAEKKFREWSAAGYTAFKIDEETREGSRVDRLGTEEREVVMIPQMAGG